MQFTKLLIIFLAFLTIKPVQAGLLIEPLVGYSTGKFETESANAEEKAKGPSFGGRLGYQNFGFQIGLDYLHSSMNVDEKNYKEDLVADEFAGFVGFEFPILLRVYAGYIFAATGETEFDYSGIEGIKKVEFSDGSGMKLGLGFTVLPFLDVNVEYRKGTYKEIKIGNTKSEDETDFSAVMVGISLPFVL